MTAAEPRDARADGRDGSGGERTPDLSVVIPSVNGWGDLEGCLRALLDQEGGVEIEVLVVDRVGQPVRGRLAAVRPSVRVLEAPADTPIPELRARGFEAARAPLVGVIEDHVIVPSDWARRMLDAHREGAEVVGGAVENAARDRLVHWAAFLCEYAQCLSPAPGPSDWLVGNNVTYRRELLDRHRAVVREGGWENRLHDTLRAEGVRLVCRPEIVVGHDRPFGFGEYVGQRYLYSRSYAGARAAGASWPARLAWVAGALALPPVLAVRIVRGVWRSGRHRRELLLSLPMIAVFTLAWAAGEAVGAALGPGDALARVR